MIDPDDPREKAWREDHQQRAESAARSIQRREQERRERVDPATNAAFEHRIASNPPEYDRASADAEQEAFLTGQEPGSSWQPVDLGPALRGEITATEPGVVFRQDGKGLFYVGNLNGIHGESGSGKSWFASWAAVEVIRSGGVVVWVDLEDPNPTTIISRFHACGLTSDQIDAGLRYVAPDTPADEIAVGHVIGIVRDDDAELVVVDSVGEAFALEGINENNDAEVAPWFHAVPARIVKATGTTVVVIDHSTKSGDAPLYPSGSKRKRAAVTGAQYLVTADPPFSRTQAGRLVITCAKDRHGNYQRNEVAAYVKVRTTSTGGIHWDIETPAPATVNDPDEQERKREGADNLQVVATMRRAQKPLNKSELVGRTKGQHQRTRQAIGRLEDTGAIVEHKVGRKTYLILADGTGWQPDANERVSDPDPSGLFS